MDLPNLIHMLGPGLPPQVRSEFAAGWTPRFVKKGHLPAQQDEVATDEVMVLDGKVVSLISDEQGRSVCVGFCKGPGIVAPHISRTLDGVSRVTLEVTADSTIAEMKADTLLKLMLGCGDIRDWANGILRKELSRKTDREWCLAALGGAARLAWFRDRYPDHEAAFAHGHIATFLGMTAVSFSRLRTRT